ncbi:hypothetical protein HG442_000370 [Candidatus Gracilibacteria bacterium]|nr:hypothetical protein [Candidatus Gracilibacteria bacterium]
MKKNLFVIDAYNLIYRMFYAIPEIHTRSGMQVNAIFGVAKFLKNLIEENPESQLVVATDVGASFRADIFSEYKGTRDRMPDNLRCQIEGVFSLFDSAKIQVIGVEGYEADDVMGTIAQKYKDSEYQVVIISSDKDLCQFVDDGKVHIYDAMKRKFMRRADVIEKFGIPPEKVRDYLAIVGDSSDNIPGIAGFGPKKAVDLLEKFDTLESIFENLDSLTPKMREGLQNNQEIAFLSQKLTKIITDIALPEIIFGNTSEKILTDEYIDNLKKYEFRSLLPADCSISAPKKDISVTEIQNLPEYQNLLIEIQKISEPIGISIDLMNKIYISVEGKVYMLDSKMLDISEFADAIFAGEIIFASYEPKEILGKLYKILHPITPKDKLQEVLF